jgi:legumain
LFCQDQILGKICLGNKTFAIFLPGSNSWYNYRHQADVCHAYQIVHEHGVPDEQIIVLM